MDKQDYCLVSFIGNTDYKEVDYVFPVSDNPITSQERIRTRLAPVALLGSKEQHWNLTNAVVIGTYTSSWNLLAHECGDDELESALVNAKGWNYDEDEDFANLQQLLGRLRAKLIDKYGIPVEPKVHMTDLTDETVLQIADFYDDLCRSLKGQNLLIDITHAYRHMPMLLFQMLQQHLISMYDRDVELVYGELSQDKTESSFRDLRMYWEISKHTDSLNRFIASYDGYNLGQYVEAEGYEEAGTWIQKFSLAIKNDQIMKVLPLARSLDMAIASIPDSDDDVPAFVKNARNELLEIRTDFGDVDNLYQVCMNLAKMLDARGMSTQAVVAIDTAIAVRMAVFTAYVLKEPDDEFIGDYDFWNINCGFSAYYDFAKGEMQYVIGAPLVVRRRSLKNSCFLVNTKKGTEFSLTPATR